MQLLARVAARGAGARVADPRSVSNFGSCAFDFCLARCENTGYSQSVVPLGLYGKRDSAASAVLSPGVVQAESALVFSLGLFLVRPSPMKWSKMGD